MQVKMSHTLSRLHRIHKSMQSRFYVITHVPVLLNEAINHLLCSKSRNDVKKYYIDCTFGMGSYSDKILSTNPNTHVLAIDLDKEATSSHVHRLKSLYGNRIQCFHGNYSNLRVFVKEFAKQNYIDDNHPFIDGVVFDLGVSSMQLDDPDRGFSFRDDRSGSLDMRMDRSNESSFTASEAVNNLSVQELTNIIDQYGEDRNAKKIATAIVGYRKMYGPISTTTVLSEIIKNVTQREKNQTINPSTKTFQALRIYVNDELKHLTEAVKQCPYVLKPGGYLCVVSFHSLEDRIVKEQLKVLGAKQEPLWLPAVKKVITASTEELDHNPRARSAKLRVLHRTNAQCLG